MDFLLTDRIKEAMSINGVDRCSIVVNGLFWVYHGSVVSAYLDNSSEHGPEIFFYTGTLKEPTYVEEVDAKLARQLKIDVDLTGLEFLSNAGYISCDVVQGEGIVFLKSSVYVMMERAMEIGADQALLVDGHGPLTEAELTQLKNAAMKWEYYAFGETMYKHYRPITTFAKYNKFYKLFRLYVPVVIESTFMFNPMLQEPRFLSSELYKMAMERNRKIVAPSGMVCYFLTELEVCKALHLHNFTRITPSLFYKVLVGAMRPDIPGFPRVARSDMDIRYVRDRGVYQDSFRNEYTLEQYANLLQEYQESPHDIENLRMFRKVDSLFTMCAREARVLRKYGGYALDQSIDAVTAGSLYKILQGVRL